MSNEVRGSLSETDFPALLRLIEYQLTEGRLTVIEEQSFTLLWSTLAVNQIRQTCNEFRLHKNSDMLS
jgi:hypothetical protein